MKRAPTVQTLDGRATSTGTATGVWKFDRKTGAEELAPGTGSMAFPNSVAFDKRGTMYITDTIGSAVWHSRTRQDGGSVGPELVRPEMFGPDLAFK